MPRKAFTGERSTGTTRMEPSASTIHSSRWDGPREKRARIGAGITVCPRAVMVLNCPHPLGRGPSIWPLLIKKRLFSKQGQKGWSYPYPG